MDNWWLLVQMLLQCSDGYGGGAVEECKGSTAKPESQRGIHKTHTTRGTAAVVHGKR